MAMMFSSALEAGCAARSSDVKRARPIHPSKSVKPDSTASQNSNWFESPIRGKQVQKSSLCLFLASLTEITRLGLGRSQPGHTQRLGQMTGILKCDKWTLSPTGENMFRM